MFPMALVKVASDVVAVHDLNEIGFPFGTNAKVIVDTSLTAWGEATAGRHVKQIRHRARDRI
jgi:hypothetical protein